MERVIVSVQLDDDGEVRDLELPAEIEAARLAELIARALGWTADLAGQSTRYEIEAQPLGRALKPSESLADAGVWDGSILVLRPTGAARAPTAPTAKGPIGGWRPLETGEPSESDEEPAATDEKPKPGFAWKELD
jgi:hypothetical protein